MVLCNIEVGVRGVVKVGGGGEMMKQDTQSSIPGSMGQCSNKVRSKTTPHIRANHSRLDIQKYGVQQKPNAILTRSAGWLREGFHFSSMHGDKTSSSGELFHRGPTLLMFFLLFRHLSVLDFCVGLVARQFHMHSFCRASPLYLFTRSSSVSCVVVIICC